MPLIGVWPTTTPETGNGEAHNSNNSTRLFEELALLFLYQISIYSSHYARIRPTYLSQLCLSVDILAKLGSISGECGIGCSEHVFWDHSVSVSFRDTSPQSGARSIAASSEWVYNNSTRCNRFIPVAWGRYNYSGDFSCATSSRIASIACNCHIVSMTTPRGVGLLTLSRPQFTFTTQIISFSFQACYVWVSMP